MANAAPADFRAVAVEEGHRKVLLFQPVIRGFMKGGDGEDQRDDRRPRAQRQAFAA